jgi:N-acetylmuramoyl-L-alanine amidase
LFIYFEELNLKITIGDRGPIVKEIQQRLLKLGYNIGPTFADGNYGEKTAAAVRKFQQKCGLQPTGVVDDHTYQKLVFESHKLGDRLLYLHYPFLKGKDVLELQKILKSFGFNPGPLDGIFGPLTEKAVREFQMSAGLAPDGIVGPQTLEKLFASAKNFGSSSVVPYPQRELEEHPLKGIVVAVDAGHGGSDPGAVSSTGLIESVLNRRIADEVSKLLNGLGANVILTYDAEKKTPLRKRLETAIKAQAILLLSFHLNSSSNPEAAGCEVLFGGKTEALEKESKKLAEILTREISSALGVKCRGVRKRKDLYLLRASSFPAVIIEPLFMSNLEEERLLLDENTFKRIATAVIRSVLKYFGHLRL